MALTEGRAIGRSRRHRIADMIRQDILTGIWRPSVWMKLEDLAERFGVSVTPVREAVQVLADEGLVEIQTRRGVRTPGITPLDIKDLFALYGFVSGLLAGHAVDHLHARGVARLEELCDLMDKETDAFVLEETNWAFHRTINSLSRSVYVTSVAKMLSRNIPRRYFALIPTWAGSAREDHREIAEAIKNGDKASARSIMEEHIRTGGVLLIQYLENTGYWAEASADGA